MNLCMGCMRELDTGNANGACPYCGFDMRTYQHPPLYLQLGTLLGDRYVIGKVLGKGGFGITYIGMDSKLRMRVAVKEYFPMGIATRGHSGSSLIWNCGEQKRRESCDLFLYEARKMAKMELVHNIVHIKDILQENLTAYIIMEYIEGENFKRYLSRTGVMGFPECVQRLAPILDALEQAHQNGIIHRDISPDNIMVREKDAELYLLDLGAAKDMDMAGTETAMYQSVPVVKHGFSPVEQYMPTEKIGPWTDVYAICATIYYAVCGYYLPAALERLRNDSPIDFHIKGSSSHGADAALLSPNAISVLQKGLSLEAKNRFQSMRDLRDALFEAVKFDEIRTVQAEGFQTVKADVPFMPETARSENAGDPVGIEGTMKMDAGAGVQKTVPVAPGNEKDEEAIFDLPEDKDVQEMENVVIDPGIKKKNVWVFMLVAVVITALGFSIYYFTSSTDRIAVVAEGECGEDGADVTWKFYNNGILEIRGNGSMENGIKSLWENYDIQKLVIGLGVTSIGRSAFSGCSSLTSVEIPGSVTSIGLAAFQGCSSLEGVEIPGSVKSIELLAFYRCSSLTSVEISEGVETIESWAFFGCNGLTSVEIPESMRSIDEYAFANCSDLREVIFKGRKEDIRISYNAFVNTSYFTASNTHDSTIPAIQAEVVAEGECGEDGADVTWKFYDNGILEIRGNGSMKNYERPWEGYEVQELIIRSGVTSIGDRAFFDCRKLTSVEVPESVKSIGSRAFFGCRNLASVEISEGVTSIGLAAFQGCISLTSVEIPGSVKSIGSRAFSICSSFTNVKIPEGVETIESWAFSDCKSLASVEIPESVKSIDEYAFANCTNLREIIFKGSRKNIRVSNSAFANTPYADIESLS